MRTLDDIAREAADDVNCADDAEAATKVIREAIDEAVALAVHEAGRVLRMARLRRAGILRKVQEKLNGSADHPPGD